MKKLLIKAIVKLAYMVSLAKSVPYYRILILLYIILLFLAGWFGGWLALFLAKILM